MTAGQIGGQSPRMSPSWRVRSCAGCTKGDRQTMYDIRIVAILAANDNGSQAPSAGPSALTTSVTMANKVFNPHGVNFLFDPATDIYRFNDDKLTRDCLRRDHQVYTDPNVEPGAAPEFLGEA